MIERRKFSRVVYQANITLQQDDKQWKGTLVDLSLHGLLINLANSEEIKEKNEINVQFTLNESDINISAECKLPNPRQWDGFFAHYEKSGQTTISLACTIKCKDEIAARLETVFVLLSK